jgi:hypothetical protein
MKGDAGYEDARCTLQDTGSKPHGRLFRHPGSALGIDPVPDIGSQVPGTRDPRSIPNG